MNPSPHERSAADFLPEQLSLRNLREAAADCRGCDLYKDATQTVFGEGRARAKVMLVGEQPGDVEDKDGRPFVGPAGKLLRKALQEAGIAERDVYLTNAVKHFKFVWRGKRRIHAKPKRIEVRACTPWLEAEIRQVRPNLVAALGATAAQALMGPSFRLTKQRGQLMSSGIAPRIVATVHPSSILRAPDEETRHEVMASFIHDLKIIAKEMGA
ncbi:MAG: uracil-DNA glycosylase [Candidatus Eremiobacter antarcticus]|nr:UdgX family uracil-DNA binding protein [Candidatus Eremiobacteraeota bacterium]MBC5807069.1 UdgX family uracil-DNA binding protein [Candidatus Eremiobacteraeota bacterium]PZR62805.1 MAG: uracil-DNA glycosylase [Candidatus Eremiobacter sp. RRmetagenome_bin22]